MPVSTLLHHSACISVCKWVLGYCWSMPDATDQWQAHSGDATIMSMDTECMCTVSTGLVDACIVSKHWCSRLDAEEVQTEHWPRAASRKPRPSRRNRDMMRYDRIGCSCGNTIASLDGARRSGQAETKNKKACVIGRPRRNSTSTSRAQPQMD